jgi:hypothetical protein
MKTMSNLDALTVHVLQYERQKPQTNTLMRHLNFFGHSKTNHLEFPTIIYHNDTRNDFTKNS